MTLDRRSTPLEIPIRKKSGRAVWNADAADELGGTALMAVTTQLASAVGIQTACDALGVARSSFYRRRLPPVLPSPRPAPPRALSEAERETVLAHLNEERFQDRGLLRASGNP